MIFVDTGAWFALLIADDANSIAAQKWFASNRTSLVTTDYVVDELLTLVRSRVDTRSSIRVGKLILDEQLADLIRIDHQDFVAAWNVFARYQDKEWSFTDCVSLVVMRRLKINIAFAFDEHFRQFGTVSVVP